MLKTERTVYISVGKPGNGSPIVNRLAVIVEHTQSDMIARANEIRDNAASKYTFVQGNLVEPSDLYYEIFKNRSDTTPIAMSFNSPYRQKYLTGAY